ncbi:MAG: hypothetical protein ACLR23_04850 [Clostridia bacterium]
MTDNRWSARREAAQALMEILYDKGYSSIVLNRRLRNLPLRRTERIEPLLPASSIPRYPSCIILTP